MKLPWQLLALLAFLALATAARFLPATGQAEKFFGALQGEHQNPKRVTFQSHRGYYESVVDVGSADDYFEVTPPGYFLGCGNTVTGLWPQVRLKASFSGLCHQLPFRTNRWGFRGDDWPAREAEAETVRIAILGNSPTLGVGVRVEEAFPAVLEGVLNEAGEGRRYRVLNAGMPGLSPFEQAGVLASILPHKPGVLIVVGNGDGDAYLNRRGLERWRNKKLMASLPAVLRAPLDEASRGNLPNLGELEKKLQVAAYRYIHDTAEAAGIKTFYVWLPSLELARNPGGDPGRHALARDAGMPSLSLGDVFPGRNRQRWVHGWDFHPNADSHRRVALKLADALRPLLTQLAAPSGTIAP